MNCIKGYMPGTTVVLKLNQGFSRRLGVLPACRQTGAAGALSCLPSGRLGTFLGKQKGTKLNKSR